MRPGAPQPQPEPVPDVQLQRECRRPVVGGGRDGEVFFHSGQAALRQQGWRLLRLPARCAQSPPPPAAATDAARSADRGGLRASPSGRRSQPAAARAPRVRTAVLAAPAPGGRLPGGQPTEVRVRPARLPQPPLARGRGSGPPPPSWQRRAPGRRCCSHGDLLLPGDILPLSLRLGSAQLAARPLAPPRRLAACARLVGEQEVQAASIDAAVANVELHVGALLAAHAAFEAQYEEHAAAQAGERRRGAPSVENSCPLTWMGRCPLALMGCLRRAPGGRVGSLPGQSMGGPHSCGAPPCLPSSLPRLAARSLDQPIQP
jgi:hypothetical protein